MKVLHVISGLRIGGAELFLSSLILATRETVQHTVVTLKEGGPVAELLHDRGVDVRYLGVSGLLGASRMVDRISAVIEAVRPDVVQTWLYHGDLFGGLAARRCKTPACWNVRQSRISLRYTKPLTYAVVLACAALSRSIPDVIVTCARAAIGKHARLGYPRSKFRLIYNGVDAREFRPDPLVRVAVREELGLEPGRVAIGVIGRFNPQKNYPVLFKVAQQLLRDDPNAVFLFMGAGLTRDNPEIARLMPSDDPRIRMLGLRRDLPKMLTALDVVLSGSLDEGFPNAVAEAMSVGACPVVTDVGDSRELVGDVGAVASNPSYSEIHAALRQVLSLDPGERKKRGVAARDRVELHFSLAKAAETYVAMWREVAARTA